MNTSKHHHPPFRGAGGFFRGAGGFFRGPGRSSPSGEVRRGLITAYCLLIGCLLATSCDTKKYLTKHQESTQTTTSNEATQLTRTEIDSDWSRIGSSLFHRNGAVWIEFDSLSRIDYLPGSGFSAIGYNAQIHGTLATTYRDTLAEVSTTRTRIEKDSTGKESTIETKKVLTKEKDKEQKSQKIAPILVLSIILIIALIYAVKQFKLF
jgi:hypothetical protein